MMGSCHFLKGGGRYSKSRENWCFSLTILGLTDNILLVIGNFKAQKSVPKDWYNRREF